MYITYMIYSFFTDKILLTLFNFLFSKQWMQTVMTVTGVMMMPTWTGTRPRCWVFEPGCHHLSPLFLEVIWKPLVTSRSRNLLRPRPSWLNLHLHPPRRCYLSLLASPCLHHRLHLFRHCYLPLQASPYLSQHFLEWPGKILNVILFLLTALC